MCQNSKKTMKLLANFIKNATNLHLRLHKPQQKCKNYIKRSINYIKIITGIKNIQKTTHLWTIRPLALYTNFSEKSQ